METFLIRYQLIGSSRVWGQTITARDRDDALSRFYKLHLPAPYVLSID